MKQSYEGLKAEVILPGTEDVTATGAPDGSEGPMDTDF